MHFGTIWSSPRATDEPEDKEALRQQIARDVDAFLAAGGEIEYGPDLVEKEPGSYARKVYLHLGREGSA